MSRKRNNNKRKNYKILSKKRDLQKDIPAHEAPEDKRSETTLTMTEIVKEDLPKIERIRKKVEKMVEETMAEDRKEEETMEGEIDDKNV